jgi:hypothetical protein
VGRRGDRRKSDKVLVLDKSAAKKIHCLTR